MEKLNEVQEPVEWQQGQHPHLGSVLTRARNKDYPKVCEDFTITDIGAFSWLKAPTSVFTFNTLLRHYIKQTLTHGICRRKIGIVCSIRHNPSLEAGGWPGPG